MSQRVFTAVCITSLTMAVFVVRCATAQEQQKVAILVGINEYKKAGFENLKYAESDVDAAGAEFKKLGFQTSVVTGRQATRKNILKTMKERVKPLGKDDFVIMMLCGHGQQLRYQENGTAHDDGFFCPFDAERGVENRDTLISLSYVIDELANHVGTKILLVDACREEPQDAGRGRGIQGKVVAIPEGTAILFACSVGQRSFEPEKLGHGIFTYCLVESLRQAEKAGGDVTWNKVVDSVYERMASTEMLANLPEGVTQRPIRADALPRTVLGRAAQVESRTDVVRTETADRGSETSGREAGFERSDNELSMKLAWCPAGSFLMGNASSERSNPDGEDFDKPVHRVTLRNGFWIGKYEVTKEQWTRVMKTQPWQQDDAGKFYDGPNYPATCVTWSDAVAFCDRLTESERSAGRLPQRSKYALPTEAQWEYACRAGTTTKWFFGDEESKYRDYGWSYNLDGDDSELRFSLHEVGKKRANPWGLFDLYGNAGEWCHDKFEIDYYRRSPAHDPEGPKTIESATAPDAVSRVIRGGNYSLRDATSSRRDPSQQNFSTVFYGFRLVLIP